MQPQIMLDEMHEAEEAIKADPDFREALRKRGIMEEAGASRPALKVV